MSDPTAPNDFSTCNDKEMSDVSVPSSSKDVVEDFSKLFNYQIKRMIMNLYSKPSLPRNVVQCVIEEIENIAVSFKFLEDTVKKILTVNSVPLDQQNKIGSMFAVFPSVLKKYKIPKLNFSPISRKEKFGKKPFSILKEKYVYLLVFSSTNMKRETVLVFIVVSTK